MCGELMTSSRLGTQGGRAFSRGLEGDKPTRQVELFSSLAKSFRVSFFNFLARLSASALVVREMTLRRNVLRDEKRCALECEDKAIGLSRLQPMWVSTLLL
jgi:hypothetical protein